MTCDKCVKNNTFLQYYKDYTGKYSEHYRILRSKRICKMNCVVVIYILLLIRKNSRRRSDTEIDPFAVKIASWVIRTSCNICGQTFVNDSINFQ